MITRNALLRTARIEYAVVRISLRAVDERIVQRYLGVDSSTRQSFERALDALDDAAAHWLGDPEPVPYADSPDDQLVRRGPFPSNAQDDDDAPAEVDGASDQVETSPEVAQEEGTDEQEEQIETLADELFDEEQPSTFAGELADNEDLRHVQAELKARRLIEEQQEQSPGSA